MQSFLSQCLQKVVHHIKTKRLVLQQDGAKCHTARRTKTFLAENGVSVMEDWPAHSPDLNVIENLWPHLKHRVGVLCPTQEGLGRAVIKAWKEIPQEQINNLILDFPQRLRRCASTHGESFQ